MNAADRIALLLGRAIMRAETLQAELDAAHARIADLEQTTQPTTTNPTRERQPCP